MNVLSQFGLAQPRSEVPSTGGGTAVGVLGRFGLARFHGGDAAPAAVAAPEHAAQGAAAPAPEEEGRAQPAPTNRKPRGTAGNRDATIQGSLYNTHNTTMLSVKNGKRKATSATRGPAKKPSGHDAAPELVDLCSSSEDEDDEGAVMVLDHAASSCSSSSSSSSANMAVEADDSDSDIDRGCTGLLLVVVVVLLLLLLLLLVVALQRYSCEQRRRGR